VVEWDRTPDTLPRCWQKGYQMSNSPLGLTGWGSILEKQYPLIPVLFNLASEQDTPLFLVGGTVRDLWQGIETHDLDFAVQGDGLRLARYVADRLGGYYVILDWKRNTGRVLLPGADRSAQTQLSHKLSLDFASLRGKDLEADLRDRDFTINAIAVKRDRDKTWHILDPLGGIHDLESRTLRTAGPHSFTNDPVRTLRAVRMCAQFGLDIEPVTFTALCSAVPLLRQVSAERVRDEWFKILVQPNASGALRELDALGLLHIIAPPFAPIEPSPAAKADRPSAPAPAFGTVQALERLWDSMFGERGAGTISIPESLAALLPELKQRYHATICDERTYAGLVKCAALLHNIAPMDPGAATTPPRSRTTLGAEIAFQLGKTWRCSNAECNLLGTVVRVGSHLIRLADRTEISRRDIYRYFRNAGEYGVDAVMVFLARCIEEEDAEMQREWPHGAQMAARLLTAYFRHRDTMIDPPLLLSGHDLLDMFGLSPGPQIGDLLARLHEGQAIGEIQSRPQAIEHVRQWITPQA
jgi:tRNA nucleotidyltransferase/poly(A) polymerase